MRRRWNVITPTRPPLQPRCVYSRDAPIPIPVSGIGSDTVLMYSYSQNVSDTTLRQRDVNLSSPSFGSYRTRSRSTFPRRCGRDGPVVCPTRGAGDPTSAGARFHCATGFYLHPLTRACRLVCGTPQPAGVSLTPSSWLLTRVFRHRQVLVSVLGIGEYPNVSTCTRSEKKWVSWTPPPCSCFGT